MIAAKWCGHLPERISSRTRTASHRATEHSSRRETGLPRWYPGICPKDMLSPTKLVSAPNSGGVRGTESRILEDVWKQPHPASLVLPCLKSVEKLTTPPVTC